MYEQAYDAPKNSLKSYWPFDLALFIAPLAPDPMSDVRTISPQKKLFSMHTAAAEVHFFSALDADRPGEKEPETDRDVAIDPKNSSGHRRNKNLRCADST